LSPAANFANQSRLKVILALDEVIHETADETADLNQDLQRLDFKINVILELLGQIMVQNNPMPESTAVKLGPRAIQWQMDSTPPAVGEALEVQAYLDHRFPFPLLLSGMVGQVTPQESGVLVHLELDELAEAAQDLLEKYIFRCHRRHIARIKTAESD
jgi:hypothetical protein